MRHAFAILDSRFLSRVGNLGTLFTMLVPGILVAVAIVLALVAIFTKAGPVPLAFLGIGLFAVLFAGCSWLRREWLGRRAKAALHPVVWDIGHARNCPAARLEAYAQARPDGIEVMTGHCLDCGAMAYRHGDRPTANARQSPGGGLLTGSAHEQLGDQLREAHQARTWLSLLDDPDSRAIPYDEDHVYLWAHKTYHVLLREFPEHSDDFMGPDAALGAPHFVTAYTFRRDEVGRTTYLEEQVAKVGSILRAVRAG